MFGRKKENYGNIDKDWIKLASSHPEIANAVIEKEELERENQNLKDQIARLKEQLSNKDSPSGSIITDPAVIKTIEERDRLEKENLELKQKLDGFKQASAAPFDEETEAKMRAELEELKNRIKSEASRSKSLSDALTKEKVELARIKENYRRTDMAEKDEITQWEYKNVNPNVETLNKLGEQGWEVVAGVTNALIMKRMKQKNEKSKNSRLRIRKIKKASRLASLHHLATDCYFFLQFLSLFQEGYRPVDYFYCNNLSCYKIPGGRFLSFF